jgi:hypothetical protein
MIEIVTEYSSPPIAKSVPAANRPKQLVRAARVGQLKQLGFSGMIEPPWFH